MLDLKYKVSLTFLFATWIYTDTQYNDNIRYNEDLTVTKPSPKR